MVFVRKRCMPGLGNQRATPMHRMHSFENRLWPCRSLLAVVVRVLSTCINPGGLPALQDRSLADRHTRGKIVLHPQE
jgi:hypothetical protein